MVHHVDVATELPPDQLPLLTTTGPPPEVAVYSLTKTFDDVTAVDDVTLEVSRGEFVALLGPSGCGKSTTLRAVAGFVEPTAGSIVIRGHDITAVPPHRRNTAMVFQSYALFPHLTVAENVAFGLRMRKVRKSDVTRRVEAALALVQLAGLDRRYPRQLSGGQQQRVALARALVIEPDVLLLDEPLSNLDAKLREEMRTEIRDLVKQSGATALYVTHDQAEALSMADRIVIMDQGRVAQVGTPADVYEHPANLFVATFIGDANVLAVMVDSTDGSDYRVRLGDSLACDVRAAPGLARKDAPAWLVVRPERVMVRPARDERTTSLAAIEVSGILTDLTYLGATARYTVQPDQGPTIRAHLPAGGFSVGVGEAVIVGWEERHARLLVSNDR